MVFEPAATPANLRQVNRDVNLLWYEPSRILVALEDDKALGAIRYAQRHDPVLKHGLLADLQVDQELSKQKQAEVAQGLIQAAEKALKSAGVTKNDVIVLDGEGRTQPFQAAGYWPWRKTVVVEWDLADIKTPESTAIRIEQPAVIDREKIFDFIVHSYQPYWQWWMEEHIEKPWLRTDFSGQDWQATVGENNKKLLQAKIALFNAKTHPVWLAYNDTELVGMVDATATSTEHSDFGVLVTFHGNGANVGSALMLTALHWLKGQGVKKARIITTSGMEDYDPTVYLYTQALGGRFVAEYLDLVKKVS